jgi:HprK-related kinase A
MRLGELSPGGVVSRLRGPGLRLALGPVTVRVRSPISGFARDLARLYGDYPLAPELEFADIDLRMMPVRGLRRWVRPQVQFVVDGVTPFEPFPRDHALPMFEWGLNWVFARRVMGHLLLHAGVVARGGQAILLPAVPGSGKSTLVASLALSGWRLLSDEFGILTLGDARVLPFPRPVALKNQSIPIIRALGDDARLGPVYPKTRKGDVAHLRVPPASVTDPFEPAAVAAVVFPRFEAGAGFSLQPLDKPTSFLKLASNAFNYEIVGEAGFRAVAAVIRTCDSYLMRYGRLEDTHDALGALVG